MSWDTFLGALSFAAEYGEYVMLGGGEITLHPKFRQMVDHIIQHTALDLHMVTNGGKAVDGVSRNVRWLIDYVDSGMTNDRLSVELSLDKFHDPVEDDIVLEWFTRYVRHPGGYSTHQRVRDVGDRKLARVGRAKDLPLADYEWQDPIPERQCVCQDFQVYPDGRIMACGCDDSPRLGSVVHQGHTMHVDLDDLDSHEQCYSPSKLALTPRESEED